MTPERVPVFERDWATLTGSQMLDLMAGKLTRPAIRVFGVLYDHANPDWVCWPSNARICDRGLVHPRHLQRALRLLEELGWIERRDGRLRGKSRREFRLVKAIAAKGERTPGGTRPPAEPVTPRPKSPGSPPGGTRQSRTSKPRNKKASSSGDRPKAPPPAPAGGAAAASSPEGDAGSADPLRDLLDDHEPWVVEAFPETLARKLQKHHPPDVVLHASARVMHAIASGAAQNPPGLLTSLCDRIHPGEVSGSPRAPQAPQDRRQAFDRQQAEDDLEWYRSQPESERIRLEDEAARRWRSGYTLTRQEWGRRVIREARQQEVG